MGDDQTRCTGNCCRSFALTGMGRTPGEIELYLRTTGQDGGYIADMVIPLRAIEIGALLPNGTILTEEPERHGWIYTCRHLDPATGNCMAYESRPRMCRDFPYGKPCEHPTCAWDTGRAGTWPPAPAHYEADGVLHLFVFNAAGLTPRAPVYVDLDDKAAG